MDFKTKVVFITGASRGIGRATAIKFIEAGATVIGTYHTHKPSDLAGIQYYSLDVTNEQQCEKIVNEVYQEHKKIDVLFNCAGIIADALTKKMDATMFNTVLQTNLVGVFNVTKQIGPRMQAAGYGSIINASSIVGEYGNMGQSNYAASKAGVIAMTKTWAREFSFKGANVRVNAIAPGYTLTDMLSTVPQDLLHRFASQTMLGRLAQPEEIANVVLFLASDMASYITGSVIDVNGGMRL